MVKLRDKHHQAQGGEHKVNRKYKHASSLTGRVRAHDNTSGPKCFKCGEICKNLGNLKNHVLSHYYQVFYDEIPDSKPYKCPLCKDHHSMDRITLIRHFAFYHKKLFVMTDVTPEDIKFAGMKKL